MENKNRCSASQNNGGLVLGAVGFNAAVVGYGIAARSGSSRKPLFPPRSPAMGVGVGFPFTLSQWKELERQATIYKYMLSSLPVPPELIHSISRSLVVSESMDSLGKRNLEPGRCKRTDGKKWRCSRDVAPHQKYCERHIHRGRPRSRKPVETKSTNNNKKARIDQPTSLIKDLSALPRPPANRELEPIIEDSLVEQQQQPWQNLMETSNLLFNSQPHFSSNFPAPEMGIGSMGMDALSTNNLINSSSFINHEDPSTSLKLSISMAVGDSLDKQMMNVSPFGDELKWRSPVSWDLGGGPLAEALKMGTSPGSPHESIATTVSSPSGVLQRTLFSNSDGSVCNSPTFIAAAPPGEFNHSFFF